MPRPRRVLAPLFAGPLRPAPRREPVAVLPMTAAEVVATPGVPVMMSLAEAAESLRLSVREVRRMCDDGKLVDWRQGRRRFVVWASVERLVRQAMGV